VRELPRSAPVPGTAESAAAAAREQAEAMAGAIEQGDLKQAVRGGQGAVRSLAEAKRMSEQGGGFFPESRADREADRARETVAGELAWAEEALRKLRQATSERAKDALDRSSGEEGAMAERARELRNKGEAGDGRMPEEMLEHLGDAEQAMRDAQKALKEGEGDKGLERQRDAQRLLEMARGEDSGQDESGEAADGRGFSKDTEVPGKDKHKGPEDFRRRVMEGLGGSADPRLKEAVRRYAEGLLK
jgi:hypothetical protein